VARLSQDATLRYYGTESFLEDLEGTRKALGYDRIVLFGLSYGTRAAYAYARRYPQSVRAVVLVGPAPVSMRLVDSVGEDGPRSLDAIVADCLGDQRCSQAFPNVVKDAEHFRTSVSDPFRLLGLPALQYSANTAVLIPTLLKSAAAGDFSPLDSAVGGIA
jgi:pimeloyl-ACP methyl ester carboxylesterase